MSSLPTEATSLGYRLSPPIQKPQGRVEDEPCCSEGGGVGERERANNQLCQVCTLGAVKPSTELAICSRKPQSQLSQGGYNVPRKKERRGDAGYQQTSIQYSGWETKETISQTSGRFQLQANTVKLSYEPCEYEHHQRGSSSALAWHSAWKVQQAASVRGAD